MWIEPMLKKRYSRRRFMKTGITWTAGLAASRHALSTPLDNRQRAVSRTSLKSLTAIPTTCKQCPAGCGVIAYLNGNRLIQILYIDVRALAWSPALFYWLKPDYAIRSEILTIT